MRIVDTGMRIVKEGTVTIDAGLGVTVNVFEVDGGSLEDLAMVVRERIIAAGQLLQSSNRVTMNLGPTAIGIEFPVLRPAGR